LAVLDAIAADIGALKPDHVAITGDVINFSTPEEFEAARVWLVGLGDPSGVTVSPGNHDALTAAGAPSSFAPWRPWLRDDGSGDEGEGFPYLRVRGPVALINLSSAVPTALHLAQGTLGGDQVRKAHALLRETGQAGLCRVVLVHHPVAQGVVAGRKTLTDAAALRAVLADAGAELVLHGHAHEALLTAVPGPRAPIPVLGVPAASTPGGGHGQPARWNEIGVSREGEGFRLHVTARGVTRGLTVEPLGSFTLA